MMGLMGSSLNPTSTIDRRLLLNVARYLENKHIQAAWLRPETLNTDWGFGFIYVFLSIHSRAMQHPATKRIRAPRFINCFA